MKPIELIERNISVRKLSSVLTALSVALGVMLVSTIIQLKYEMQDSYMRPGRGYSLVVGAPGAPLQLVLNAVYHVEDSPGLMPLSAFEDLASSPSVALAVPYAVGDSFRGYRVIGTDSSFFSPIVPHPQGDKLRDGRAFSSGAEGGEHFEAVLGADVADSLGIGVGARIEPSHGIEGGGVAHTDGHEWEVVGVLRRSGTAIDRLVLINLESFYRIRDHQGGVIPETGELGLSAVLVFPKPGMHKGILLAQLRKRSDLQVAEVQTEIRRLFKIVGNIDRLFFMVASLVILIGVISIMVAIYNTMTERRVEIATLRAIGARRRTIFGLVLGEATILATAGGLLGLLLGHLLTFVASGWVEDTAGLSLDPWVIRPAELMVVVVVALVGAIAGLLPAWKAYRTDVASNLSSLG